MKRWLMRLVCRVAGHRPALMVTATICDRCRTVLVEHRNVIHLPVNRRRRYKPERRQGWTN